MTNSVFVLGEYLQNEGVKQVAMESMSIYWTPVSVSKLTCKSVIRVIEALISGETNTDNLVKLVCVFYVHPIGRNFAIGDFCSWVKLY